jgi:hypothetical protein
MQAVTARLRTARPVPDSCSRTRWTIDSDEELMERLAQGTQTRRGVDHGKLHEVMVWASGFTSTGLV